jgi:hypothetical protein
MHSRRRHWRYFFPFQLLLLHLKKNHFLLAVWVLLFSVITGSLGQRIGIPQQFLVPEYLGKTGVVSFAIVGFSVGGFISGYNLYTYMMHGYRFPVIATLSRPFHKFCINNFLLPALFLITYIISSARFQIVKECIAPQDVILNLISFVLALMVFQTVSFVYFLHTNKEAEAFGNQEQSEGVQHEDSSVESHIHRPMKWISSRLIGHKWRVDTYMSSFRKIAWARDGRHYKREVLQQVFEQNHLNASRFELLILVSFLFLGAVASVEWFIIPAAASVLLFLTMLIMTISALHSWLRGWTFTILVLFIALLNFAHRQLSWFQNPTKAYGLNYENAPAFYNPQELFPDSVTVKHDILNMEEILKARLQPKADSLRKPKLVILNHSGGGSRSAFWTMRAIPYADSICEGKLLRHTVLMTGASGGMVGAAYLRELMIQSASGRINLNDPRYAERIGQDLLNPVMLAATTGDWFIRYRRLADDNYSYSKDRATALEEQLERNTLGAFNTRLSDYIVPEKQGEIPLIILSPTIARDGRRLIIGSQPFSFLCSNIDSDNPMNQLFVENIEFARLFKSHDAMHLRFSSALRMNATFPYVTPMSTLPTEPSIEVIDAGIRDNFGWKTTCAFLHSMRNWIESNTSGVVIVQVRDLPRDKELTESSSTLLSKFSAPLGGIYGNLTRTQDYNGESALQYLKSAFHVPIETIQFQLEQTKESQVSLSWHLTRSEKNYIRDAVNEPFFKTELGRLQDLLR